jgi:hypothetical protein
VHPEEPGVARVELAVPADVDELPDTYLHRVIALFADRLRVLGPLVQGRPPVWWVPAAGTGRLWRGLAGSGVRRDRRR